MNDVLFELVVARLDVLLLEQTHTGLQLLGAPPAWAAAFITASPSFDSSRFSPFLSEFLADARSFWQNESGGERYSGIWIEIDSSGKEHHLEATAMLLADRSILMIRPSDPGMLSVIQIARQTSLRRETQLARGQKDNELLTNQIYTAAQANADLAAMNEELDRRVRQRTADLMQANQLLHSEIEDRKQRARQLLEYQRNLRALAAQVSRAEEQERQNIARGLHDHIGQALVVTQMKLREAKDCAPADVRQLLDQIRPVLDKAIKHIRNLTFELGARVLYQFGLGAAVESLLEHLQAEHGLRGEFTEDAPLTLPEDVQVTLYQGVRELLHNIVKHAQAKSVKVQLKRDGDEAILRVSDDGVGCTIKRPGTTVSREGGFGLFSLRERLDYLGGHMTIEKQEGGGTTATMFVPLQPRSAQPRDKS